MSNSDKFTQDDAIVADDSVPQQAVGVLDGDDETLPSDGNYESVRDNQVGQDEFENDEFDGVRKENILDSSERSTRGKTNYAQADDEADRLVDNVTEANVGTSRIA
ncbi:uncharacterized protein JCM10292_002118 [Rhodotorula paludigena]|uniref:uncharacterized protein n=1 Tax=Rhodotorula paludigena TaxID=86838 RepID=UPI0031762F24